MKNIKIKLAGESLAECLHISNERAEELCEEISKVHTEKFFNMEIGEQLAKLIEFAENIQEEAFIMAGFGAYIFDNFDEVDD